MHYYKVLLLKNTGKGNDIFTYSSSNAIEVGAMVAVTLKNKKLRGIIIKSAKKPSFKTKEIERILTKNPVISDMQISLAEKISKYYFCSLGETINSFFPFELGKKRRTTDFQTTSPKKAEKKLILSPAQKEIYKKIKEKNTQKPHLIHGVTGSGKTEIYLQLVADALEEQKGSIILIPEISLTPQTMERFEKRFPNQVVLWHSQLKETEKYNSWSQLKSGEKKIVLGARSAIFMPVKDLAYIIIDEEHENSYKQDQNPKYETIKVSKWKAELTGAKIILGSATPKIETFYKAKNNEYFYYSINERIIQKKLPPINIIDMREEFRKGNKSIFSDKLANEIREIIKEKKQVLLMVNRRGAATFVVCRDCGTVEKCPKCEIPLIFHLGKNNLLCHHCDFKKNIPTICSNCKSYAIKYFGLGTQRVELEVKKLLPKATVSRMDKDTTKKRGSHESIFQDFKEKKIDILIGTQMIAKGWDLPDVDLVGIIAADTTLNIPDYQSSEKTFSLLTQMAGRTGRSEKQGKVIIQTYNPESYAIEYAKNHDYIGFYQEEIISRDKYQYPPFSRFIKLTLRTKNEEKGSIGAESLEKELKKAKLGEDISIIGPFQAFIYKKGGYYNWHIVLKIHLQKKNNKKKEEERIISINKKLEKIIPKNWSVDVDPENLL